MCCQHPFGTFFEQCQLCDKVVYDWNIGRTSGAYSNFSSHHSLNFGSRYLKFFHPQLCPPMRKCVGLNRVIHVTWKDSRHRLPYQLLAQNNKRSSYSSRDKSDPAVAPSSLRQSILRRLSLKRSPPRPSRRTSLSKFLSTIRMAQPLDSIRHTYSGSHIRQKLKSIVTANVDPRTISGGREPAVQARILEDRLAEEEKINKVDAKDVAAVPGDEKLALFPTYARVKPHFLQIGRAHV